MVIRQVSPRTRAMFAMLLPITLPIASSGAEPIAAMMATASSGAEVPKAITVAPIAKGLIFKKRESLTLPLTKKSPP